MRIFLMDTDEQEVSMDVSGPLQHPLLYTLKSNKTQSNPQDCFFQVAQYVNLELPILHRVLRKLHEEENKEVQRVVNK